MSSRNQKSAAIFAPASQFGFRKNADPSHYNMRFKPSQGLDGNYIATAAPYHGPNGAEPVSTFSPIKLSSPVSLCQ